MNTSPQTINLDLKDIIKPISNEQILLNTFIIENLDSPIPLIKEIVAHILKGKGKRLRPLLVILSARACNYQEGDHHLRLAAIIEFVHTATLLHDDVVDESKLRRGNSTANSIWGNQASVLVGDFLYSRAFQLLTAVNNQTIMQILASTTNTIAEGEVLQLMNSQDASLSEEQYFDIIYRKTAKLFESSAKIGASLTNSKWQENMASFGKHLGICFQIVDDLLDYTASPQQIGKNIGDDLADGKMTLPLIYALQQATTDDQKIIRQAIKSKQTTQLTQIIQIIQSTAAISKCKKIACQHASLAKQALLELPDSVYKESLLNLVEFAASRSY